jgi:hypothetical protein
MNALKTGHKNAIWVEYGRKLHIADTKKHTTPAILPDRNAIFPKKLANFGLSSKDFPKACGPFPERCRSNAIA